MKPATVSDVLGEFVAQNLPANTPQAQKQFLECLFPALITALPYFLQALMTCLAGGGTNPPGDHNPGDRLRCED